MIVEKLGNRGGRDMSDAFERESTDRTGECIVWCGSRVSHLEHFVGKGLVSEVCRDLTKHKVNLPVIKMVRNEFEFISAFSDLHLPEYQLSCCIAISQKNLLNFGPRNSASTHFVDNHDIYVVETI